MKKLALAIASLAIAATPVLACPNHESSDDNTQEQAPRTAEKAKAKEAPKPTEKAKAAPKADTAKKAEPKKDTKPAEKKPSEKVSAK